MLGYRDLMERKRGHVLTDIRQDEEFAGLVTLQANEIIYNTAYLFDAICRNYGRRTEPLWKRFVKGAEHEWGSSIFGPVLERAGLIRLEKGEYVPTEKGLEIYQRHAEEHHTPDVSNKHDMHELSEF